MENQGRFEQGCRKYFIPISLNPLSPPGSDHWRVLLSLPARIQLDGSWSLQSKPLQALSQFKSRSHGVHISRFYTAFSQLVYFPFTAIKFTFLDKMAIFFCEQTACKKINYNFSCSKLDDETGYIFKNNLDKKSTKLLSLIINDPPPLSSKYAS